MASTRQMTFPSMPSLAHSYNSRGELGMFVNPYACSCVTCVDHVDQERAQADGGGHILPAPPTIREQIAAEALVELSRSFTGLARSDSIVNNWSPPVTPSAGTGAAGGGLGLSSWTTGMVRFASPPIFTSPITLTRSVTGFNYRPSDVVVEEEEEEKECDGTGTLPADSPRAEKPVTLSGAQAQTTAESLREMIQILRDRQDDVYDENCRSHDEMAAQDAEWDELDRKIADLDGIISTLEA